MGILLLLAVVGLAFLCGRLQVTVNRLRAAQSELTERVAVLDHDFETLSGRVDLLGSFGSFSPLSSEN